MLVVGVGPSPVKNILPIGMVFQIEGASTHQFIAAPQADELRLPPSCRNSTATVLQCQQIGVSHKWGRTVLLEKQTIPVFGGNLFQMRVHPDAIIVQLFLHMTYDA